MAVGRIFWVAHITHLGHRNLRHFHFIIATLYVPQHRDTNLCSSGFADRVETSVVYSACTLSYLILTPQPTQQVSKLL